MKTTLLLTFLFAASAFAADPVAQNPVAQIYDGQVRTVEREILPMAQAMPADKYDFAPPASAGTFTGVRTFGMQVRHIATMIYSCAASVLNEKPPVEMGNDFNGSDSLKTKEQIVKYFQDALAYAHKAVGTMTAQNMLDEVPSPFGFGKTQRLSAAGTIAFHSYDHYGQMVVYGRMNGVIPPSSQPRNGPGAVKGKGKQ